MSLAGDMIAAGLDLMGSALGSAAGDLTQAGSTSSLAFTGFVETRRRRTPRPGQADREDLEGILPASGISEAPRPDALVVFTGGTQTWLVIESQPLSGEAGWRLRLRNEVRREEGSE